jgi:hypothetical protein
MRCKIFSMVAVVVFMVAALSGHVSGEKGETVTITEDLLLGEWEGNNRVDHKITAKFERNGIATFAHIFPNGKVASWSMKYSFAGDEVEFSGKRPSGSTWIGKLQARTSNKLVGDYTYTNDAGSDFPGTLWLYKKAN